MTGMRNIGRVLVLAGTLSLIWNLPSRAGAQGRASHPGFDLGPMAQKAVAPAPSEGSARNVLQHFAAGEVRGSEFFPFEAKGPARWASGPHELEENLGQAARSAQIIDLGPFEGKSLFLDVAQLPQFYGVRLLGSCDSQLGNVLWENTWDRGDLVMDLLASG